MIKIYKTVAEAYERYSRLRPLENPSIIKYNEGFIVITNRKRVSDFIRKKKKEGITELSVADISAATGVAPVYVNIIMERYEKSGRVKSVYSLKTKEA